MATRAGNRGGWQLGCLAGLAGLIGLALLIAGALSANQEPPNLPWPTAVLWTATPTPLPTPTSIPTPTPPPSTPLPATDIGIGSVVQVTGTSDLGLSLRAAPGTAAERLDIATEGERFLVIAGPEEADGLIWWRLRDEANPQREGWAAANYLALVE